MMPLPVEPTNYIPFTKGSDIIVYQFVTVPELETMKLRSSTTPP
jgi:hypothetical protein